MTQPIGVQIDLPLGESLLTIPAEHALVSGLPMLPWEQRGNVGGTAFVSTILRVPEISIIQKGFWIPLASEMHVDLARCRKGELGVSARNHHNSQ